jgi:hypothetical protein
MRMRIGLSRAGRETRWLMLVTACYVVAQPLLFHMGRFLVYDEAVYVSEVYPGMTPTGFTAPRARGIPWLISPVSMFSPPVIVIRYYLLLVCGALFFVAFRAWVPTLRMRAVAAAALFATGWLTLYFGTEIFPNLPVALGAIAAAGFLAQHLSRQLDDRTKRRALVKAAVAVALVAVVRPVEATFLAMGLLVVAVTWNRRLLFARWAVIGSGLIIGWIPWVVEAYIRYHGFIARMRAASANAETGGFHPANAWHYLTLTDGPLAGTTDKTAPVLGYLWWLLIVVGVVLAIRRIVRYGDRTAAVAACAGLASAAEYLLLDEVVQARFLLPAYGLLTVCLVAALPSVPAARAQRASVWAVIALSFAVFAGWNVRIARAVDNQQYLAAQSSLKLGQALRTLSSNGPCFFASQFAYPEIAFASRCRGAIFYTSRDAIQLPANPGSSPVYILTTTDPTKLAIRPVSGTVRRLQGNGITPAWWVFVAPRHSVHVLAHPGKSRAGARLSPPDPKFQQAQGVGEDVPLAAVDLLVVVKAAARGRDDALRGRV